MSLVALRLLALLLPVTCACTYVDVKARENLRLGPLREMRPVPTSVDHVVTVDAGTDAFTDAELTSVEDALASSLEGAFTDLANDGDRDGRALVRLGTARVGACKLRAGPNERFVLYIAKCHVSVVVDGVVVAEATAESLRRTQSVFLRKRPPASAASSAPGAVEGERDLLVDVAESKRALVGALEAAARVLVDGPLPPRDDEPAVLPRARRAEIARERLASAVTSDEKVAALFDLRSAGVPKDAALAVAHLEATMLPADAQARTRAPGAPRAGVSEPEPPREHPRAPVIGAEPSDDEPSAPAPERAPVDQPAAESVPVLDVAVVAAALDAIGELCDPALTARVNAVAPAETDDAIARAKGRALSRLRACSQIAR